MPGKGPRPTDPVFDMPDSAAQGVVVLGMASNFKAGETLKVDLYNSGNTLIALGIGTAVADKTGYAGIDISIGNNLAPGVYIFNCVGQKSRKQASDMMTVTTPTPTYQASLTPNTQTPAVNQEVIIGAAGFAPNEQLNITVTQPSGSNFQMAPIFTDASGIAVFGYTPLVAGMYGVSAVGQTSQALAVTQFLAS